MTELAANLRHALDPVAFAGGALGVTPDPWQAGVLRSTGKRILLNCSRQSGKSTVAAVLALHRAIFYPNSLILLVSPSLRQSGELFRKVTELLKRLAAAPDRTEESRLSLTLENGSRVVSLPSSENTVRGYSAVSLIIEDEAAWVSDELYHAIRPMLAVSGGRLVLMSTPFGQRGHFHAEWAQGGERWERVRVTARDVPRISAEFLEDERRSLGAWRFAQEYECQFVQTEGQVFAYDDVKRAMRDEVGPLGDDDRGPFVVGVDLGQARDRTAVVVLDRVKLALPAPAAHRAFRPFLVDGETAAAQRAMVERHRVRHVERVALGTPYPAIVSRVRELAASLRCRGPTTIVVDATGVGRAVVDLFEASGVYPVPVTITAGDATRESSGGLRVPKRDLVAAVQVLLQERRLDIAAALAEAPALVDELLAFRVRVAERTAHDSYGAAGTTHDDLVLALALACWQAARDAKQPAASPVTVPSEPWLEAEDEGWVGWPLPLGPGDRPSARFIPGARGTGASPWRAR